MVVKAEIPDPQKGKKTNKEVKPKKVKKLK